MRPVVLLVLLAFLARVLLGAGAVLCQHAHGDARIEWIGSTCCGGECLSPLASTEVGVGAADGCSCQDAPFVQPPAVEPQAKAERAVVTVALLDLPDAPRLDAMQPRAWRPVPDLVHDPGRPRAIGTTILRS